MSTVTLSNPHCAIISAEKPEGIASQALTTALPDFQISLTLFATLPSFPVVVTRCHCARPCPPKLEEGKAEATQSGHLSTDTLWVASELALLAMRQCSYVVARWMLTSLTPTSRAVFTIAAHV